MTSWTTRSPSAISCCTSKRRSENVSCSRSHRLPHGVGADRQIGVLRLVVGELRMDELVHDVEVALRVDLLERAPGESLVVVGHGARL